jgi:hypothetical protein
MGWVNGEAGGGFFVKERLNFSKKHYISLILRDFDS